jgi:hypothetical protein
MRQELNAKYAQRIFDSVMAGASLKKRGS